MSRQLATVRPELTRWSPWPDFDGTNRLSRLIDSLWSPGDGSTELLPGASLEETDDAFVFEIDLPGVSKDDITIEVSNNRVSVKGDRKEEKRDGILRRSTRVTGSFAYEVTMPAPIDGQDVAATMADGVLKITTPKAMAARPTRIAIA